MITRCTFVVYKGGSGSYFFKPARMSLAQMRRAGATYSDPYRTKRAAQSAARKAAKACKRR